MHHALTNKPHLKINKYFNNDFIMMNRMMILASRRSAAAATPSPSLPSGRCGAVAVARRDLASSSAAASASSATRDYGVDGVGGGVGEGGRFSIKGTFREGRASYLDASSTTPLDPRVLDKMMPYMVGF
jgi:hypothetical protein